MAMGLTFSLPHAFAEDTRPPIRELKPGSGQKKRIPSLERIYYYYDAGQLELEPNFEYSAIYVTMEDENTHRVWTGTATPEAPTVSAPEAPGSYYITTVTDLGKTFSGYLYL